MTGPEQDRDDAAWLEALAGRDGGAPDGVSGRQAAALRSALERRRALLDAAVPVADKALFRRIADEVQADQQDPGEEIAGAAHPAPKSSRLGAREPDVFYSIRQTESDLPPVPKLAAPRYWQRPWAWGIAASVLLATVLSIQMWPGQLHEEDGPALRGPNVTVQIVPDPESRSAELAALLQATGASPRIERTGDGTVVIHVEATPGVLDALAAQRLMPQPKDGKIVIRLERPAAGKP